MLDRLRGADSGRRPRAVQAPSSISAFRGARRKTLMGKPEAVIAIVDGDLSVREGLESPIRPE
jgi:hypothetical protein